MVNDRACGRGTPFAVAPATRGNKLTGIANNAVVEREPIETAAAAATQPHPPVWSRPVRPSSFVLFGGCVYLVAARFFASFHEQPSATHPLDAVVALFAFVVAFAVGATAAGIIAAVLWRVRSRRALTPRAALLVLIPLVPIFGSLLVEQTNLRLGDRTTQTAAVAEQLVAAVPNGDVWFRTDSRDAGFASSQYRPCRDGQVSLSQRISETSPEQLAPAVVAIADELRAKGWELRRRTSSTALEDYNDQLVARKESQVVVVSAERVVSSAYVYIYSYAGSCLASYDIAAYPNPPD